MMGMANRIECIFFSEFHPTLGPKITYQVSVHIVYLLCLPSQINVYNKGNGNKMTTIVLFNTTVTTNIA